MKDAKANQSLVVLRLSRSFRESIHISANRSQLTVVGPLMTWYVDVLTIEEEHRFAFFTEEQTLYTVLIPLPRSTTEQTLVMQFLNRLKGLCNTCHIQFDPDNCTVAFTGRSDRRIISSQVNLMELSQDYLRGTTPEQINQAERDLNITPMGLLGMASPTQKFGALASKDEYS